jgi:hypothetical protein
VKNIDLETFYGRAKTTLEIACSYVGDSSLNKLITSCRLKPMTVFDGTFKGGRLETWWADEFGNSLFLTGNKPSVVKSDPSIKMDTKISTDLFYGRSILGTAKISKSVILAGEFLAFYGHDEYFRCFNKDNGLKVSALEMGPHLISKILEGIGYKFKDGRPDYLIYGLPNADVETFMKKEYARYE